MQKPSLNYFDSLLVSGSFSTFSGTLNSLLMSPHQLTPDRNSLPNEITNTTETATKTFILDISYLFSKEFD